MKHILRGLRPKSIAVFGDFILDKYTFGEIHRISPEAPVPILEVRHVDWKVGGAGNVLMNIAELGMQGVAYGRVGADAHGRRLLELMRKRGHISARLLRSGRTPTIVKNRIVANNQQLLRLDEEAVLPLTPGEEKRVLAGFRRDLPRLDAVVLSDYAKGFLTQSLIGDIIRLARARGLPVIADPKGKDFSKYRGATVITPNLKEAHAASTLENAPLEKVAEELISKAQLDFLMVTLGKDGIATFRKEGGRLRRRHFPVENVQEVIDVTGAGDTVVAVAALCLANGVEHDVMCRLCNLAAGYVVGHFGAAAIDFATLRRLARDSA